jgi:predicted DNA-binding transcriptional regulator AlpA
MHVLNGPVETGPEFLTRPQAAAVLGLSPETLRRWYAEGRGPTVCKVGTKRSSRVRYPRALLLQWAANPQAFTEPARPEGLPRFEPPRRGVKRTVGAP